MANNCINTQPQRMLRGVTRTVYITLVDGASRPVDLTQAESVVVTVSLDGASSQWSFHPVHSIGGEDHNVVTFVWYADQQVRCGRYTIDVTADFGERMVSRVDWHRQFGVELVEHSVDVSDGATPNMETEGDVELTGNLIITTAGESALEEWILSPESEGYPKTEEGFFAWMRQPAVDAETTVEANEAERVTAEQGRVQAESVRDTVFRADHLRAIEDHDAAINDRTVAASDHTRASQDHATAVDDHEAAVTGATVTVDGSSGTPSVLASVINHILTIAFSGLKGADGRPGPQGEQGDTGSSIDYPFRLVNSLDSDALDAAVTAAKIKVLKNTTLPKKNTQQSGMHLVDESGNVAMKYDGNGFDVALLSQHFISLLESLGIGSAHIYETVEHGFFVTDRAGYIGFAVETTGIRPSALRYDFV